MRTLSIDVETRSGANLAKSGAYRYAADPDFDLLLFAYSVDDGPATVISLATGENIPHHILHAITDPTITKWAFNAAFERITIGHWLHNQGLAPTPRLNPAGWRCSMVHATALGLPRSLKDAAKALDLDAQKMGEGADLIKHFCIPHKAKTTTTPQLFDTTNLVHWNNPTSAPEKWADFIEYNRQDVTVENELRHKLAPMPLPDWVWNEYTIDQHINDHGIRLDLDLAHAAIHVDDTHRAHCTDEAEELTGLNNPNSPTALRQWLHDNDIPIESMTKDAVTDALATATGTAKRVLELRQDMSRSSTTKYDAMLKATIPTTERAHGLLQFYGAGRTGRWAGRLIQVQNLPRNYLPDLDNARELIRSRDVDALELLYDSIPDTLSQLIRTAFIPADGHRFIVADYSAIEARVLAWLAKEQWRLDLFNQGGDIYCQSASNMFGVPVEKNGVNADLRQKGKVAELACGYGGGVGALKAMGALRMGMDEHELQPIITAWRDTNTNVTAFWRHLENAAIHTITHKTTAQVGRHLHTNWKNGALTITLPSGRDLIYPGARLGTNRFGNTSIVFQGIGMNRKQQAEETYGGKLVENVTQAVARDLLSYALTTVHNAGHRIVMHVHDEIVVEAPPETTVDEICNLMAHKPDWAEGLPHEADGFECTYYQKD